MLLAPILAAATPTPFPTVSPITTVIPTVTPAGTPTVTPAGTPTVTPVSTASPTPTLTTHGTLILWLVVGGIIAAGIVIIWGRNLMKSGQGGQAASLVRSWIAISLIIGLLVFCAASLLGNDPPLQSTLFGGLIASTGAAIAFYFSSKGADQARADILNAAATMGQAATQPSGFSNITPPNGQAGTAYDYRIVANGLPAPQYSVVDGDLPPGLVLDSDGTLHGQPTTAGSSSTFKIAAYNSAGLLVSSDLTITIS
jgi:hypothetical protein